MHGLGLVIAEDFTELVPLLFESTRVVAVVFAVEHQDVVEGQG